MRVLFVSYGPRPHSFPMMPLAWAFRIAGHDVLMAGPPAINEPMAESGLPGVIVGADADVTAFVAGGKFRPRPPEPGETPEDVLTRFVDGIAPIAFIRCEAMVDELVTFASRWQPDLIVYDPVTFAGPVAAAVLGIPAVCNLYGMVRQFRIEMAGLAGNSLRAEYVKSFERFGVAPQAEPAAWIDPCPPSLRWEQPGVGDEAGAATPRLPMSYIRYNGPGRLPDWLADPGPRPRVLLTWGTTSEQKLGREVLDQFRNVVEAAAPLDVEVIVTVGQTTTDWLESFREAAPNVRTVGWLPLHAIAEASAVVVHTGGTGAVLTTAACGRPQLGITTIPEGTFNATKVAEAGAGLRLSPAEADVATVRSGIDALLNEPSYQENATKLRAEIDGQPSPADVVRSLEGLVTGGA